MKFIVVKLVTYHCFESKLVRSLSMNGASTDGWENPHSFFPLDPREINFSIAYPKVTEKEREWERKQFDFQSSRRGRPVTYRRLASPISVHVPFPGLPKEIGNFFPNGSWKALESERICKKEGVCCGEEELNSIEGRPNCGDVGERRKTEILLNLTEIWPQTEKIRTKRKSPGWEN